MKAVIQRVKYSKLFIDNREHCSINEGLVVFLGINKSDDESLFQWFANKIMNLRIFTDENGVMNKSLLETGRELMLVSNFTLYGETKKGFRPSYSNAMSPEKAYDLYYNFVNFVKENYNEIKIVSGEFGAMMEIEIMNSGPVTIIVEKDIFSN